MADQTIDLKNQTEKVSIHPYEPFIPYNATKLIIGTIPPYRFCQNAGIKAKDVFFYYGSEDNQFWDLVYKSVYGSTQKLIKDNSNEAVEQRKKTLELLGIGVTDIIKSCIHLGGKSDDKSLKVVSQKNIRELLLEKRAENIDTLIYTSDFVKTQMNSQGNKSYHTCVNKDNRTWQIEINQKVYKVIILYSPSPNALRGIDEETRQTQYKEVFKRRTE